MNKAGLAHCGLGVADKNVGIQWHYLKELLQHLRSIHCDLESLLGEASLFIGSDQHDQLVGLMAELDLRC